MNRPFVFLDLDDTILDFHWAERRALTAALLHAGIEPTEELLRRYSEINLRQWELLELGQITREAALLRRFEILFREWDIHASAAAVHNDYESRLAIGHCFVPGAREMLDSLQGRCRLYLASNGSAAVQAGRIASAGIEPLFQDIFISEELGADKPSREYFTRCFARIPGFSPANAMMVGDSLTSDIRGGINAGIKTCWFNPIGKPGREDIVPDFQIRHLSELPSLLERVFYSPGT